MTITEFLLARIAEDEEVARAAVEEGRPGMQWQWVCDENDVPVAPGDEGEALQHQNISLRTVEEWPVALFDDGRTSSLPGFLIHAIDEGVPEALRHIALHDPARAKAECDAKRGIVEACTEPGPDDEDAGMQDWEGDLRGHAELMLCLLASVYADHPDYRDEWQV